MNNQRWIVATLAVLVAISCFAVPLLADTTDADTPKKEGHGSGNGVTVSYVDSETDGYGIITLVIDRVPACDYLTVRLDGTDSAPISIPADGRIVFATAGQLALGDHSVTVSWDGFRSNIVLSVGYQGEGDAVTGNHIFLNMQRASNANERNNKIIDAFYRVRKKTECMITYVIV